jgi:hypothetical protein
MQVKRPRSRRELMQKLDAIRQEMCQHCSALPPEEAKQRKARAKADPWYFFATYLPHYFSQETPEFHRDLWSESGKPGINALAAPRGFAKSTLVTTAETLRRAVFGITPFQIIVKETEDAAIDEVAAIQVEIEDNPRIIADFGALKKRGDWEDGDFITTTGCRVRALGIGQSIRGKKHRQYRPGRVVVDDPEKDKAVQNPRLVRERVDWLLGAVYPSLDPAGGILTWIGTLISRRSGLAVMQKHDGANTRVWSAIMNGVSLWPERFPLEKLKEIRGLVGPKAWRTEYMNEPADDPEATFQDSMIHRFKREEVAAGKIVGAFVAADPSLESTTKHDCKAITVLLLAAEFRGLPGPYYLVIRAYVRHATLEKFFAEIFRCNELYKPMRIGLEIQSWQKLLLNDIRRMEAAKNIRLPLVGLTHSVSKEGRVGRLQPLMERGMLLFVDDPDDDNMNELIEQFLGFDEPSVKDDGPDSCEMAIALAERHGRKIGRVRKW